MRPVALIDRPGSGAGTRGAGSRLRAIGRVNFSLLAAGGVVLLAVLLVSAATPPEAQALSIGPVDLNPLNWPGKLVGGVGGDIAKFAVGAFDAIIKALFAPIAKFITTQLIGWLITVPNLTQGNVSQLEQTVEAMGGGLLGAVATISIIRYWAAGFAGGGDSAFSALEGLIRTVAAALFLAAWPWLFDTAVHLTNLFTSSLMGSGAVVHSVSHLLAAGLGAGIALNVAPIGLFLNIAMAVAASLLFLGLLVLKIVVSISTILVFIGMPLAAVIWPVVPWVARLAMRAFAVCLIVPVLWALCFAASAAVSLNAITFSGSTVMNTLLQPLVAIVLLWVTVKLPIHLARVAMLGAAPLGSGFASRAVSYAAGSQTRDTLKGQLPGWTGGQAQATQTSSSESRTASRLRNAATLAGAAATGGTGAAAAATAGSGLGAGGSATATGASSASATGAGTATSAGTANGAARGRAYTPPASAQDNASGRALQNGLQTPSFAGREQDFANEKFEAQYRERTNPVSGEQAQAALASLPADTQRAIGQLVSDHGPGAREHLAYQAIGEWSPEQREALRTLAAATPDVRAQALNDTIGTPGYGPGEKDSAGAHGGAAASDGQPTNAAPRAEREPPPAEVTDETPTGPQRGAAMNEGLRNPMSDPAGSPPAGQAPPAPGQPPTQSQDHPAAPPSLPPARRPPPREPRGPNPDDLFRDG